MVNESVLINSTRATAHMHGKNETQHILYVYNTIYWRCSIHLNMSYIQIRLMRKRVSIVYDLGIKTNFPFWKLNAKFRRTKS